MKLWAIQWGPYPTNPRSRAGWIDVSTIRPQRNQAWAAWTSQNIGEGEAGARPEWKQELMRRRRKGWIKAIRVTLERIEP